MKTPKRVKGWVATRPTSKVVVATAVTRLQGDATEQANLHPDSRLIRVVELRRGEVIVDVEALCQHFWETHSGPYHDIEQLRAALRKVGKR